MFLLFVVGLLVGIVALIVVVAGADQKQQNNLEQLSSGRQERFSVSDDDVGMALRVEVSGFDPQSESPTASDHQLLGWSSSSNAVRPTVEVPGAGAAQWQGRSATWEFHGHRYESPKVFTSRGDKNIDASTINTKLKVANTLGACDDDLGYWPSYAGMSPAQRATYLRHLAEGWVEPDVPIGYVFVYFYGLERRLFSDKRDIPEVENEVLRLLSVYKHNRSLQGYALRCLSFSAALRLDSLSESDIVRLLEVVDDAPRQVVDVALAFYCKHQLKLPARVAEKTVSQMEYATRSVVRKRAPEELSALFARRYLEATDGGLLLTSSKRPLRVWYGPASSSLHGVGSFDVKVDNVLGRSSQFKKALAIYNGCINDLKKVSGQRLKEEKGGLETDVLSPAMWEALPDELRADVDHPLMDVWQKTVNEAPKAGQMHAVPLKDLASFLDLKLAKTLSKGRATRLAETAASLGYGFEPDPRLTGKSINADATLFVFRQESEELPDADEYRAVASLLALMMKIVLADGIVDERELNVVSETINTLFSPEENLLIRVRALREMMLRDPPRTAAIAKKIRETKTPAEAASVARILVAVAAADDVLDKSEYKQLKSLFKALGRPLSELDAALVSFNIRDEAHKPVAVRKTAAAANDGETIVHPTEAAAPNDLDFARIEEILHDSRHVTKILADTFDGTDDNAEADAVETEQDDAPVFATSPAVVDNSEHLVELGDAGHALDVRYHAIAAELFGRPSWTSDEVAGLSRDHRLTPGAVYEVINAWAEDQFGDELIEEDGGWILHRDLLHGEA